MRMQTRCVPTLPKLSWLATLDLASSALTVVHGTHVEHGEDWLVEGVWEGDFSSAEFHCSENFFGSGIRVKDGVVHFVPSSSLVDRLIYCLHRSILLVSNSLPLLLGFTGARLDPDHNYHAESYAIVMGLKKYEKKFVVLHPEIDCFVQQYEANILVKGGNISFASRTRVREIDSYSTYLGLLREALRGIEGNYKSKARKFPMTPFVSMSTGYDSPAAAVLVRDIGVRTCFTSRRSTSGMPMWLSRRAAIDDAKPIADCLGIDTIYLDPKRSKISEDELYFLAATTAPPEIIFHSMAKHFDAHCDVALVFTGYHGDKVWDVHSSGKYLADEMIRGDTSGLNLGEIRLKSGFIHAAVPFISAKSMRSIVAISRSEEMRPWTLKSAYDRPIPRRIVEGAGVKRGLFGYRKKGAIYKYSFPINRTLRQLFFEFLREKHGLPRRTVYGIDFTERLATTFGSFLARLRTVTTGAPSISHPVVLSKKVDISRLMYHWAVTTLAERLGAALREDAQM
jgi:hypothetical protein